MAKEFSRSVVSQAVALAMVEAVRKGGYLKGAMVASPVLAEAEKELLVKMLGPPRRAPQKGGGGVDGG